MALSIVFLIVFWRLARKHTDFGWAASLPVFCIYSLHIAYSKQLLRKSVLFYLLPSVDQFLSGLQETSVSPFSHYCQAFYVDSRINSIWAGFFGNKVQFAAFLHHLTILAVGFPARLPRCHDLRVQRWMHEWAYRISDPALAILPRCSSRDRSIKSVHGRRVATKKYSFHHVFRQRLQGSVANR